MNSYTGLWVKLFSVFWQDFTYFRCKMCLVRLEAAAGRGLPAKAIELFFSWPCPQLWFRDAQLPHTHTRTHTHTHTHTHTRSEWKSSVSALLQSLPLLAPSFTIHHLSCKRYIWGFTKGILTYTLWSYYNGFNQRTKIQIYTHANIKCNFIYHLFY